MKKLLTALFVAALALGGPVYGQAPPVSECVIALGPQGQQSCIPLAGTSQFHLVAANTNNSTLISAGYHFLVGMQLSGLGSAPAYVKLYDKATAPTCGTDTPTKTLMIPAASTAANGGGSNVAISFGTSFSLGLGICVVTGIADSDNTAVAASTFVVNLDYR